jgi:enolase-phosphatase E1
LSISAVLLDIEGTVSPIAFVKEVLFPFARARLPAFCESGAEVLNEVPAPRLETLLGWMDRDEKVTALKAIQGMLWEEGYTSGEIVAELYPEVAGLLRRWARAGVKLFVYSSGSVPAQKLLFGHTAAGDLTGLFQGFFDTRVGAKREAASYGVIARGANITPAEFLFLSDVEAELDAAAEAGFVTSQIVRARDGTVASARHDVAADLIEIASKFKLPRA